jgi:hypothetical protein
MSRPVHIPTSTPASSTTGKPVMPDSSISACTSPIDCDGRTVIGLAMTACWNFFTRRTILACSSGEQLR